MRLVRSFFLSLALAVVAAASFAQVGSFLDPDRPAAGGTFNTPGYQTPNNTRPGPRGPIMPGDPRGSIDPMQPGMPPSVRGAAPPSRAASAPDAQQQLLQRRFAPPPKPSEFQQFVEGATGRLLPIFGARFFADAADTFAAARQRAGARPTTPSGPATR